MTTQTLEQQMAQIDATLRSLTMPPHIVKDIERGEAARAEFERTKARLIAERDALREAQRTQVTLATYEQRKAEREREEAQDAAARATLKTQVAERADLFDDYIANLARAAQAAAAILAKDDEIGRITMALTPNARRSDAVNTLQTATDLSLAVGAVFKASMPATFRHRWGTLTWSAASDGRWRPGAAWVEDEKQRLEQQVIAPLCKAQG